MALTLTTLLSTAGATMPTAYSQDAAQGSKAYLGRLETWLFTVEVARVTVDQKVKFQMTTDDPDVTPKWADVESRRRDTNVTSAEHTFAATGTYEIEVRTWGSRAVRPLGISVGAAGAGDAMIIKSALPLVGL